MEYEWNIWIFKTVMSGTEGLFELECKKDLFGVMARYLSSYLEQELPGLVGFWSVLGDEPPRLTIISDNPVPSIFFPIILKYALTAWNVPIIMI
jgi:hypothetical protein